MAGQPGRSGGARPNPGPKKGSKQRRTIERELVAQRAAEALEREAQAAEAKVVAAYRSGRKLAKEVLDDFMQLFAGMAAVYQPPPPGAVNERSDEKKFNHYAELAVDCAAKLAPYQSPTFRAISVMAPPPSAQAPPMIEGTVSKTKVGNPEQVYRQMIKQVG